MLLGELVDILDNKRKPITKHDRTPGSYPYYGATGVLDWVSAFLFDEPLVLIGEDGAKWGAGESSAFQIAGKTWVNNHAHVLRPHREKVLDEWLIYYLNATDLSEFISGMTVPKLNQGRLREIPIPLPPLEEQKRIVAVLDQAFAALDRARAHAEANLADAHEFLESFVEQQLDKSGGEVVSLQELLDSGAITGHLDGNHGSDYPRKEEFVETGVPYISANCLADQDIDIEQAKFLSEERASRMRKGVAQDRDVLFAHNATVGPVALLRTKLSKIILSTSLTYYRCNSDKVLPEFLVYEMRGANFRRQYESVMRQATRNQVPITAQRKFVHVIPSIAEQRRIMERCAEIEVLSRRLVEQYSNEIRDLASLRQSLLQKAFSGELI